MNNFSFWYFAFNVFQKLINKNIACNLSHLLSQTRTELAYIAPRAKSYLVPPFLKVFVKRPICAYNIPYFSPLEISAHGKCPHLPPLVMFLESDIWHCVNILVTICQQFQKFVCKWLRKALTWWFLILKEYCREEKYQKCYLFKIEIFI